MPDRPTVFGVGFVTGQTSRQKRLEIAGPPAKLMSKRQRLSRQKTPLFPHVTKVWRPQNRPLRQKALLQNASLRRALVGPKSPFTALTLHTLKREHCPPKQRPLKKSGSGWDRHRGVSGAQPLTGASASGPRVSRADHSWPLARS